jgi:hypothetical protein
MDSKLSAKLVSLFLALSVCLLGYVSMSTWGTTTPIPGGGLRIDAIPAYFNANRTMVMDFTSAHAGIVVYPDALLVRSSYYISSYTTNISSGNFNSNLVVGTHCYASIPVQNATLTAIGEREELENIGLEASGGSVTVSILRDEPTIVQLRINSTSTPTLTVSLSGLIAGDWYQVTMDSTTVYERVYADVNGAMTFSVSGPWSSHDLTVTDQNPMRSFGQLSEWIIAIGFAVGLFAIIIVAVFSRVKKRG